MGESAVEADGAEKVGPCARGIFHYAAEEMLMKLIDVLASIFVAFGWHTVDWMTGVDDALNKGHLNVLLMYFEHQ